MGTPVPTALQTGILPVIIRLEMGLLFDRTRMYELLTVANQAW